MNRFVTFASRALDPGEREAVIGDLIESGEPDSRAFANVLGLVIRRQLQLWTTWKPWFALIGVAGVSGFNLGLILSAVGFSIDLQLLSWQRYGVAYNTGVTSLEDQLIQVGVQAAAIVCSTAVNSSLLRRLSGRAAWLTVPFFCFMVIDSGLVFGLLRGSVRWHGSTPGWMPLVWLLPLQPRRLMLVIPLFVIPVIAGVRRQLRALLPITVICTIAAAALAEIRAHDLERFSSGVFQATPWPLVIAPYLLVSWPCLVKLRSA